MMTIELTDAAYDAALARGRDRLSLPHAIAVRYDTENQMLTVLFNTKLTISFDPSTVDMLRDLPASALADVQVSPGGAGLMFGARAASVSLPGLLARVIPFDIVQHAILSREGKGAPPNPAVAPAAGPLS